MAILRSDEINDMDSKEMEEKVFELRNELLRERSKVASGGAPDNPGRVKEIKRTIARILTIENMKTKEVERQKEKKSTKRRNG
ncbi:MAG: 50S ribosomal protein L29 [Candidatus Hydrothermarchaeales archaeon]